MSETKLPPADETVAQRPTGGTWVATGKKAVVLFLLAVPFLAYVLCLQRLAVNIPFEDDYDAVLRFMLEFLRAGSWGEKLTLLFSQHNEHRLVFDRLIFLASYYLFGELNFVYFIAIGNLGWLLTVVLLIRYSRKRYGLSLAAILPIPYLLLAFTHFENMFFAMASLSNYWFFLFSLTFIICLVEERPAACCLLFPIALFTSGGGVVLYPLGSLYFAARKSWKSAAWFGSLSTLWVACYFIGYHRPSWHPKPFEAFASPGRMLHFMFDFLGNIWQVPNLPVSVEPLSFITGIALTLVATYILYAKRFDPFFWLIFAYIAISVFTSSLARSGFGIMYALESRYSIYPLFTTACCVVGAASLSLRNPSCKWLTMSAIVLSILFWGVMSVEKSQLQDLWQQRQNRVVGMNAFTTGVIGGLFYSNQYQAAQILLSSQRAHIYNYKYIAQ